MRKLLLSILLLLIMTIAIVSFNYKDSRNVVTPSHAAAPQLVSATLE